MWGIRIDQEHIQEVVNISHKLTIDEVDKILYEHNLIRIDEKYVNNSTKILCIDNNGYKVSYEEWFDSDNETKYKITIRWDMDNGKL